ncbi:MAG: class I SAM-dependent methyltransferase [Fibrobacterota bacterium]
MKKTVLKPNYGGKAQLLNFLKALKSARMADIATGKGAFLEFLTSNIGRYHEIVGIDIDPADLGIAAKVSKRRGKVSFKVCNAERLPFPDNHFDLIGLSNALHHIENIPVVFKEIQRVLKKSGWLLVNEMNYDRTNQAQKMHQKCHAFRARVENLHGKTHRPVWKKMAIVNTLRKYFPEWKRVYFYYPGETYHKGNPITVKQQLGKINAALQSCKGLKEYSSLLNKAKKIRKELNQYGVRHPSYTLTALLK